MTTADGTLTPYDPTPTIISQYSTAPTINAIIAAMAQWKNQAANIDNFYFTVWNIATASGWGLDVWGRILGISRLQKTPLTDPYWGFIEATTLSAWPFNTGLKKPNQPGGIFYNGETLLTDYTPMQDDGFRVLLMAKAAFNIIYTSSQAINEMLLILFPITETASFVGSVSGTALTVTTMNSGSIVLGNMVRTAATSYGTILTTPISGGVGSYRLSTPAAVNVTTAIPMVTTARGRITAQFKATITGNTMAVTQITSGKISKGDAVSDPGQKYSTVASQSVGTPGGAGTYTLMNSVVAASGSFITTTGGAYIQDNGDMSMTYVFMFIPDDVETTIIQNSGVLPHPSGVSVTISTP